MKSYWLVRYRKTLVMVVVVLTVNTHITNGQFHIWKINNHLILIVSLSFMFFWYDLKFRVTVKNYIYIFYRFCSWHQYKISDIKINLFFLFLPLPFSSSVSLHSCELCLYKQSDKLL